MFLLYCVKCRKKSVAKEVEFITLKNGKDAVKGKCSHCGTAMFKIGNSVMTLPEELDEAKELYAKGLSLVEIKNILETRKTLTNILKSKL